ncbi:MAG: chromosomal replication initiator protein DnaA [Thermodesulfobacteriota bacterium]
MEELFNRLMAALEKELPADDYQRWFLPLKPKSLATRQFIIQVPNIFFKTWINDHYGLRIRKLIDEIADQNMDLEFDCARPENSDPTAFPSPAPESTSEPAASRYDYYETGLTSKYTFSNFVVGSSNQLAHAASLAVANRSAAYNPLFLYGGSGLGKTHLLNAIGNHLVGQNHNLRVVYRSSEAFTNELIEALRTEGMSDFRKKYRRIDALLIDDIHFIGGKERTQEEFFYTFNALYEAEKQIILSSDKMPKDISDLEDRLRSRFEGGLFADISPPDRETKVAILTRKAMEEGIELGTDVGFYLASQNETNIRVLEGYLARLCTYASLTRKPIDLDTAQRLLGLFIEADRKQITLDLIIKVTADFFQLKTSDFRSSKKHKNLALPRQAAMYLARQFTSLSTIEIGQRFGGRDHSTVIHAVKKIERVMENDKSLARTISELEKTIKTSATAREG